MSGARPYAVVTGAGRGIGRAVALAIAGRGLDVALVGRTHDDLDATAKGVLALGVSPWVLACDVADATRVKATCEQLVSAHGAPRVLVNNAGIARRVRVEDTTDDDWEQVLGVNLSGTFYMTRGLLPAMRAAGRGRIVNVASISSTLGTPLQTAYNASKWGVLGFTKSLAEELRGSGLQALAVLPGAVDTPMLAGSAFLPQMSPEAVAGTLVYAALDAPDAMNGSALEIFGP
jgi:3-oxoacyl-[acyl-carrier protein] reductase